MDPANNKPVLPVPPGMTPQQMYEFYSQNSTLYDQSHKETNCIAPGMIAELANQYFRDKDVSLLDVAAGTGIVGEKLFSHGFTRIDALDGCQAMLDVAREKQIYNNYMCVMLGKGKDIAVSDDTYDGVVICGALYIGHMDEYCFDELIRITKTGGFILMIGCKKTLPDDVVNRIQQLQDQGVWNIVERKEFPKYITNLDGTYFVVQVL